VKEGRSLQRERAVDLPVKLKISCATLCTSESTSSLYRSLSIAETMEVVEGQPRALDLPFAEFHSAAPPPLLLFELNLQPSTSTCPLFVSSLSSSLLSDDSKLPCST